MVPSIRENERFAGLEINFRQAVSIHETGSCNGETGGSVVLAAGTSDYSASFVSNRDVKS